VDVGVLPTPALYLALHTLTVDGGIQVTGSHNPPEFNGFKMVVPGDTLHGDDIQRLRRMIETDDLESGSGTIESDTTVLERYIEAVVQRNGPLARRVKVAVDCGNGAASLTAERILTRLGAQVTTLFCDSDGTFPNHHPDPTVVENLARLRARGVTVVEPASGDLACGYQGKGRLPDPAAIVEEVERMLSPHDLASERILVTAGPTQEMIDPVRFVSNRSTGKMGFAIARAAWRRGASVRLVAGPSPLGTPYGAERIDTVSAAEMLNATARNFPWSTALVMAAAVADFRPTHQAPHKIKKNARGMTLELEGIEDEMPRLSARKGSRIVIGFAAETQGLEENAADKLRRKRLDLIVANDVSRNDAGFAVDTNIVTIIGDDGRAIEHPKLSKDEVADVILDRLLALRAAKSGRRTLRAVR
jgi:hypothetical protein